MAMLKTLKKTFAPTDPIVKIIPQIIAEENHSRAFIIIYITVRYWKINSIKRTVIFLKYLYNNINSDNEMDNFEKPATFNSAKVPRKNLYFSTS